MLGPPTIIEEQLRKTRKAIRQGPDRIDALLPFVGDVPVERREDFNIEIRVFLRTLENHYAVWSELLSESEKHKTKPIRRIK